MRDARRSGNGGWDGSVPVWLASVILAAVLYRPWMAQAAEEAEGGPPGERKVAMKEIPPWEVSGERARQSFLQGGYAHVQDHKEWGATYPEFKSAAPLYGQAHFQGLAGEAGKSPSLLLAFDHSEGCKDNGRSWSIGRENATCFS